MKRFVGKLRSYIFMRNKTVLFFIQKRQKVCNYDQINDDMIDCSSAVGPVGAGCGTLAQV